MYKKKKVISSCFEAYLKTVELSDTKSFPSQMLLQNSGEKFFWQSTVSKMGQTCMLHYLEDEEDMLALQQRFFVSPL